MKPIFQKSLKNIPDSPQDSSERQPTHRRNKELFSVTTSLGTLNLFSLAIPMFLESFLNTTLGTVSTLVLSGYSDEAVAATGAANPLISLFSLFFTVISIGATTVISNYIGSEELPRAAKNCFTALFFCTGLSVLFAVALFIFSGPVVGLMGLTGTVYEQAVIFFRLRMLALPVSAFTSILLAILRCYGFSKSTVTVGLTTNILNLAFSYYVVYHATWAPITGVSGVAFATIASQCISLLLTLLFFKRAHISVVRPNKQEFLTELRAIMRIGLPSGLSSSSFVISQVITTGFIAELGDTAISAKVYYANLLTYAYLFSSAMGSANSLLIGRLCGAGRNDHARALNRQLVKITVAVNLFVSLSLLFLRIPLLSLFTDEKWILAASFGIFLVDIIAEQARAVSQVYEYALRAAGDVTFTMVILIISCWVCGVGLSYVLSIPLGLGLIGCWIGLATDETVRAVSTVLRWHTNKWVYFHKQRN